MARVWSVFRSPKKQAFLFWLGAVSQRGWRGGDLTACLRRRVRSQIFYSGVFAGVHLQEGGQLPRALIGRTFLRRYKMVYEGLTGTVTLESARLSPSDRGFEFEKGRQLLICLHNKASSVAALCGHNPNWSAFAIRSRHTAAIPSSVAKIFEDDLPILHLDFACIIACH